MSENSRLLRQARQQSLITFMECANRLLIPGYTHFYYCDLVAALAEDLVAPHRSGRLAINLPPRHGKSIMMIAIAAWHLGTYPEKEVLLVCHSQSLAYDLAGRLCQLLRSVLFSETFSQFALMPGRESASDFRTSSGGGFMAASLDSGITGRGADLILIDDAISAQDAGSAAKRTSMRDAFDNMILSRVNDPKRSAIILLAHRMHDDDLTSHLVKKGFGHIVLPFQAKEDEE